MALPVSAEYRRDFEAFLAGETIVSPDPVYLGEFRAETLRELRCADIGNRSYAQYTDTSVGDEGRRRSLILPDDPPVIATSIAEFCEVVDERDDEGLYFSRGKFSRLGQRRDDTEVTAPHLDSIEGDDNCDYEPLSIVIAAVGASALVFSGMIARRDEDDTIAQTVRGRWIKLREGGIYQLMPTTVHRQPRAPLLRPRNRYFWQHVMQPRWYN